MNTVPATADVAGAIADIERRRLATENDAGMALACSAALHRLQELLDHETEALRLRGSTSAHLGNVEAISAEIGRVRKLRAVTHGGAARRIMNPAAGR
jgi:uncharacterized protein HemY